MHIEHLVQCLAYSKCPIKVGYCYFVFIAVNNVSLLTVPLSIPSTAEGKEELPARTPPSWPLWQPGGKEGGNLCGRKVGSFHLCSWTVFSFPMALERTLFWG